MIRLSYHLQAVSWLFLEGWELLFIIGSLPDHYLVFRKRHWRRNWRSPCFFLAKKTSFLIKVTLKIVFDLVLLRRRPFPWTCYAPNTSVPLSVHHEKFLFITLFVSLSEKPIQRAHDHQLLVIYHVDDCSNNPCGFYYHFWCLFIQRQMMQTKTAPVSKGGMCLRVAAPRVVLFRVLILCFSPNFENLLLIMCWKSMRMLNIHELQQL